MPLIQKILVPTDGSDGALFASRIAAEIARYSGAEVTVFYVVQVTGVTQFLTDTLDAENVKSDIEKSGEEIISDTKHPFLEADVTPHSKMVEGIAADMIIKEANEGKYDLIIMGSHGAGTGFVERVVHGLGSTTQRVAASTDCSVLIARP